MAQRNASRRRQQKGESFMDYSLLFIVLFLVGFGMVMVFSSSSYEANLKMGDSTSYLRQQLFASILGLVAMMVVANIPYHFWERFAVPAYIGSVVLILLIIPFCHNSIRASLWRVYSGIFLQQAV